MFETLFTSGPAYRGPETSPKVNYLPQWDKLTDVGKVKFLRAQVNTYASDPRMRLLAAGILQRANVQERNYPAMASALLRFVQDNVYYVEERGEQIYSPWRTLQAGMGDCDDAALLLASLAASINLRCRFVISGRYRGKKIRWVEGSKPPPSDAVFTHIYCEFQWPAGGPRWAASADPVMKDAPLGYDFSLHGAEVDDHGRPFLTPLHTLAAEETGFRPLISSSKMAQGFGEVGDSDLSHVSAGKIVNRQRTGALLSRVWNEVTIAVPVAVVTLIATFYVEKWLRKHSK